MPWALHPRFHGLIWAGLTLGYILGNLAVAVANASRTVARLEPSAPACDGVPRAAMSAWACAAVFNSSESATTPRPFAERNGFTSISIRWRICLIPATVDSAWTADICAGGTELTQAAITMPEIAHRMVSIVECIKRRRPSV